MPLDGQLLCLIKPYDTPFVINIPNYRVSDTLMKINTQINLQITGFSESIEYFEDAKVFNKKYEAFSPDNLFFAIGLFKQDGSKVNPPEAKVILSEKIKKVDVIKNSDTKKNFYHLTLTILGGDIDVVSDVEKMTLKPTVGGYIFGSFYLSGKLLN